ncbi:unnamed protein product [Microthlaspi erraticum]|uniref:Uncharacterized protein n=1 Tax=Microthlaspi erraticum TaxID=1685480 RepID=A0A6D2I510_9BRAS|nr:unnamed protein product [Microthlaspi erraticum]
MQCNKSKQSSEVSSTKTRVESEQSTSSIEFRDELRQTKLKLDRVEAWPVELRNSTGWSSRRSSWSSRWLLPSSFAYPVELLPCAKSLHAPYVPYAPECSKRPISKDQTCIYRGYVTLLTAFGEAEAPLILGEAVALKTLRLWEELPCKVLEAFVAVLRPAGRKLAPNLWEAGTLSYDRPSGLGRVLVKEAAAAWVAKDALTI